MIMVFFARLKRVMFDILPKWSKFNQLYFVDYIFPDLKRVNEHFHHGIPQVPF
jgi:hypothetical protein